MRNLFVRPGLSRPVPPTERQSKKKIFVFCVKTSGPKHNDPDANHIHDRIVDIAVAPYVPKQAASDINPHSKLVNPMIRVSTERLAEHNIRKPELQAASSFECAWDSICEHILSKCEANERPVLVAHEADFQVACLRMELDKCGKDFPEWEFVCSMEAAQKVWPLQSAQIDDLAKQLKIQHLDRARTYAHVRVLCVILDGMNKKFVDDAKFGMRQGKLMKKFLLKEAKSFEEFGQGHQWRASPGSLSEDDSSSSDGSLSRISPSPSPEDSGTVHTATRQIASLSIEESEPSQPEPSHPGSSHPGPSQPSPQRNGQSQHLSSPTRPPARENLEAASASTEEPSPAVLPPVQQTTAHRRTESVTAESPYKPSSSSAGAGSQTSYNHTPPPRLDDGDSSQAVYYSPGGNRYHVIPGCWGLRNVPKHSVMSCNIGALPSGRTPCRSSDCINASPRPSTSPSPRRLSRNAPVPNPRTDTDVVYLSPSGSKYHVIRGCWGLRNVSDDDVIICNKDSIPADKGACNSDCRDVVQNLASVY